MKINKKAILKHIFVPVIFGVVIGNLLTLIFNWREFFSLEIFLQQSFYGSVLTLLFWKGNEGIIRFLLRKSSFLEHTTRKIIIHAALTFTYTLLVIILFYFYIWFILMHKHNFTGFYDHFKVGIFICMSINFIVTLFFYSYNFMKAWKESVLNEEQLKRESLTLQFESLKNQVNPHFLFNSLNILTSLIEKDAASSIAYVKHLSDIFRYVLDQNAREMVPVSTELQFIESYIYLHKIRFGESFRTSVEIKNMDFNIVPMTLQILIENAVKHNEISQEKPLTIEISDDKEYLSVKNNCQKRNYLPESKQIGLKSLQFQYGYLSNKNLEIINNGENFIVKVPKLN